MSQADSGIANLEPLARAQEQKAWYWYDWANSAFATTIAGVRVNIWVSVIAMTGATAWLVRHRSDPGRPGDAVGESDRPDQPAHL